MVNVGILAFGSSYQRLVWGDRWVVGMIRLLVNGRPAQAASSAVLASPGAVAEEDGRPLG